MVLYTIGEVLRDIRISRGYSQEALCYGICSRGNLSKIENGKRIPRWFTIEALLHRLGDSSAYCIRFMRKDELKVYESYQNIINSITNDKRPELSDIENMDQIKENSKIMNQFKKLIQILSCGNENEKKSNLLNALISSMHITMPGFNIRTIKNCFLLSYTEVFILYYIGIYLYDLDSKKYAWEILLWLKGYIEKKIIDIEEKAKLFPMILYRISFWTQQEHDILESVNLTNISIVYCVKYDKMNYLVKLLYLKAISLLALKQADEAEKCFVQAHTISEIMHFGKNGSQECEDEYCLQLRLQQFL